MDERRSIAQDLVESVRKEAVGQVAKSVVRAVKAVLVAALAAICVLAWSLWTANPLATVALAVVSLSFGLAVGQAVGWRRACKAKDVETEKAVANAVRPLQEQLDRLLGREQFAKMRLRGLSPKELEIIRRMMSQSGEVYLKVNDASVMHLCEQGAIRINNETYCPPDQYPFTLDDSLRSLLVEFPSVLEEVMEESSEAMERYLAKAPSSPETTQ